MDSTNLPFLKTWADDIIFPPLNGSTFNLRDTSGSVFDKTNFLKKEYPFLNTHAESIALKYGDKWRLTNIEKQDEFIDGFSEVRIEGDHWVAKKKNKESYYRISNLSRVKKKN